MHMVLIYVYADAEIRGDEDNKENSPQFPIKMAQGGRNSQRSKENETLF